MNRKTEALRAKRRASLIVMALGRRRRNVCEGAQDKMVVKTFHLISYLLFLTSSCL